VALVRGKHVLVTGASGFIGRALMSRLAASGATVIALSRRELASGVTSARSILMPLEQLTAGHWDRAGIRQFDTVFHLGAFIPKRRCDADDIDANFASNLAGTKRLLESFAAPPGRFIFASSIDVYAPMAPNASLTETSPVEAATLYASTKLCGERMVAAWGAQTGAEVAVLRYGHVYGPGEGAYEKLIPHTIRTLLAGQNPIIYGDGSPERDCVYVADVVEATVRCASSERAPAGPVNIVSGVSHRIADIVQCLIETTGSAATIDRQPGHAGDRSFRFDNKVMLANFGTWRLTPLNEGLRAEVEHVRAGR
jgi:nucleoside-diphosphate-sugar epimerase